MNIAGPVKDSPLIRRGFARGRQLLERQFLRCGIKPLKIDLSKAVTGPEAFYVLDAEPLTIKKLTTLVEDASPLGRLFDMDVLRPLGCEAEGEMLAATHGVNTHKGAIFSIGIVCAALGRLDRAVWADPARVLAEVSTMTAGLTAKDFAGVTAENAVTAGQKLYVQYGITGVRGQVEAGLPAVLEFGLPALEKGLAAGYSLNQSGCGALLAIIANSTDTNLIARSDRATQLAVVEELKALLARTPYPDEAALCALDDRFIAANLSPGGSADLLALCYLLHFFKTEVLEDV